jgi:Ner family transcriptional regulator
MAKKSRTKQDWHREDIKAALRKGGSSFSMLARKHGYHVSAVRLALVVPYPKMERLIAEALGTTPPVIWPSRYTPGALANPRNWRRLNNVNCSPSAPAGNVNSELAA